MKPVCKLYTIAADSQSISNLVYLTWIKMHGLFAFYKQLQGVARGDINGYTINVYGKYLCSYVWKN